MLSSCHQHSGSVPTHSTSIMRAQGRSWASVFHAALRPVAAIALLVIVLLGAIIACWHALPDDDDVLSGGSAASAGASLTHMDIGSVQRVLGPLREVVDSSPGLSLLLFSLVFLLKTTTCLPGASVLVLLAGALWPWWLAAGLALSLVLVGSLVSFFLSQAVVGDGGQWLSIFFGDKIVEAVRSRINTVRGASSFVCSVVGAVWVHPTDLGGTLRNVVDPAGLALSPTPCAMHAARVAAVAVAVYSVCWYLQARQERRLKWAVLAVRLFPATPGCVVNMLSPQLQVPIGTFVWTLVLGNLPWISITAFAGSSLVRTCIPCALTAMLIAL